MTKANEQRIAEAIDSAETLTQRPLNITTDTGKKPSPTDVLIALAQSAELFHTPEGEGFADVLVGDRRHTYALRGRDLRLWLIGGYYKETGRAANNEALRDALDLLQAKARFDGVERPVHVRVGEHEGRIYLDLGDDSWQAIEIDAEGWRPVDAPPLRFRRSKGVLALPMPVRAGTVDELRTFLNVPNDQVFVLAVAFVLAAFRGRGPYPILALSGEQGSAKSTFARVLRALVDPNAAPLRTLPREDRELFIAAGNAHVLAFDNVSGLPPWLSDSLCRLATGGAFSARQLYTDSDEVIFQASRPVMLNGIEDVVEQPDLAERTLLATLDAIPDERRRPENDLWREFAKVHARILGALLDAVAHGIRMLPTTHLDALPRMADFAIWLTACETAMWPAGTFMSAYRGNRYDAVLDMIFGNPFTAAVVRFTETKRTWGGTATELLNALDNTVDENARKSRGWPKSAGGLSGRLRRSATNLRRIGVHVDFDRDKTRRRERHIFLTHPAGMVPEPSSASSVSSETADEVPRRDGDSTGQAQDSPVFAPALARRGDLLTFERPPDGSDGSDANCGVLAGSQEDQDDVRFED